MNLVIRANDAYGSRFIHYLAYSGIPLSKGGAVVAFQPIAGVSHRTWVGTVNGKPISLMLAPSEDAPTEASVITVIRTKDHITLLQGEDRTYFFKANRTKRFRSARTAIAKHIAKSLQ